MCKDTDKGNNKDRMQMSPVIHEDVSNKVDDRCCHNDEENKHWDHLEEEIG